MLLKNGATKVYEIDVGYGQLAWGLRCDERVVSMERTNIRYVTPAMLQEVPQIAVMDLSFISIKLVLPVVRSLLCDDGEIVCLIKPQFEAGKDKEGQKGVVRDKAVHREVIESFLEVPEANSSAIKGIGFSPTKGT